MSEIIKRSIEVKIHMVASFIKINDNLWCFKYTVTPSQESVRFNLTTSQSQGFINAKNYKKIKAGRPFEYKQNYYIVPQKFLEHMAKVPWGMNGYEVFSELCHDSFDVLDADPSALERLVEVSFESHMIFDLSGNPFPVAKGIDYISSNINDENYDLNKAVKEFKKRGDITFDDSDTPIQRIPYYNASRSRSSFIPCVWSPSRETYTKVWNECKKMGGKYPSVNFWPAVFNIDALGLRACGAAKFDSFYGGYASRSYDDDED